MRKPKGSCTPSKSNAEATIKDLIAGNPDIFFDSPLGVRIGLIAKLLFLNEIYQKIQGLPGALMEIGAWYGQILSFWKI